jgi:hypothetical protein
VAEVVTPPLSSGVTSQVLTDTVIAEAIASGKRVACRPGEGRCYAFPDSVEDARASCTPKGRCRVGGTRRVIVANSGRDSWDVWLDLHTGEGRLRRQVR